MAKKVDTVKLQNKDYATVSVRIKQFREDCIHGSITTEPKIEGGMVTFKATIRKDQSDEFSPIATGHSYGDSADDKAFEKLETIAIGRALANLGYMASGVVASSEEMEDFVSQKEVKRLNKIQEMKDSIDKIKTIDELREFFKNNKAHGLGKEVDDYMMVVSKTLKDKKTPKK